MFSTIRDCNLRYLIRNLSYLLTRDLSSDMMQSELRREILYQRILRLPEPAATMYRDEIDYLRVSGLVAFPYRQIRSLESIEHGWDADKGMPFVIHSAKRLYFPSSWSESRAAILIMAFAERWGECIEGENGG